MSETLSRKRDERLALVARIEELLNQNLTRSQIGERMGMTRDQVQGLIYKNLQHRMKPPAPRIEDPPQFPRNRPRPRPSAPVTIAEGEIIKDEVDFAPPEGKFSVWNIKHNQCRYVQEDGFFCAEATDPGKSYCPAHHQLCNVPAPPRKVRPCSYQPKVFEDFV